MKYWIPLLLIITACSHPQPPSESPQNNFTLGQVQLKVKKGENQADVAQCLGAPNIVTRDKEGKETWIYDKIGTEVIYSNKDGGVWLVIVGSSSQAGYTKTSQKTLTVVIKFNC